MTYTTGTVKEFKHSRPNSDIYIASVNESTTEFYWEDKIVVRAATREEAVALQKIIVNVLNKEYNEQH